MRYAILVTVCSMVFLGIGATTLSGYQDESPKRHQNKDKSLKKHQDKGFEKHFRGEIDEHFRVHPERYYRGHHPRRHSPRHRQRGQHQPRHPIILGNTGSLDIILMQIDRGSAIIILEGSHAPRYRRHHSPAPTRCGIEQKRSKRH